MGNEVVKMGTDTSLTTGDGEELQLRVDDRGRVTIPKDIRDRLGIEPDTEVSARISGSTLTVDPRPSSRIQTASADRENWTDSTPTDAGESLFGGRDDPAFDGDATDR